MVASDNQMQTTPLTSYNIDLTKKDFLTKERTKLVSSPRVSFAKTQEFIIFGLGTYGSLHSSLAPFFTTQIFQIRIILHSFLLLVHEFSVVHMIKLREKEGGGLNNCVHSFSTGLFIYSTLRRGNDNEGNYISNQLRLQ